MRIAELQGHFVLIQICLPLVGPKKPARSQSEVDKNFCAWDTLIAWISNHEIVLGLIYPPTIKLFNKQLCNFFFWFFLLFYFVSSSSMILFRTWEREKERERERFWHSEFFYRFFLITPRYQILSRWNRSLWYLIILSLSQQFACESSIVFIINSPNTINHLRDLPQSFILYLGMLRKHIIEITCRNYML